MTQWLAVGTTLAGLVCYFAAGKAESYHNQRFAQHRRNLLRYDERELPDKISHEIESFHTDQRLDLAAATMAWGYPLATAFFLATALLIALGR